MKIEAASRLVAIEIEPSEYAYSDRIGAIALSRYKPAKVTKIIPISNSDLTIAIIQLPQNYFVYLVRGKEAIGCITLNRFRGHIWLPHSYFKSEYRGLGYALMLYKWVLAAGMILLNDGTQSPQSNGLWKRLAKNYLLVSMSDKELLVGALALKVIEDPTYYRIALLGKGRSVSELREVFYDDD